MILTISIRKPPKKQQTPSALQVNTDKQIDYDADESPHASEDEDPLEDFDPTGPIHVSQHSKSWKDKKGEKHQK